MKKALIVIIILAGAIIAFLVLSPLMVIIELDEAEANLHAKQKETQRIIESVLSQLESGAGSEIDYPKKHPLLNDDTSKVQIKNIDEMKYNIGTVQLNGKDLRKVHKQLYSRLEEFKPPDLGLIMKEKNSSEFEKQMAAAIERAKLEEDAEIYIKHLNLYAYISMLLYAAEYLELPKNYSKYSISITKPEKVLSTEAKNPD